MSKLKAVNDDMAAILRAQEERVEASDDFDRAKYRLGQADWELMHALVQAGFYECLSVKHARVRRLCRHLRED